MAYRAMGGYGMPILRRGNTKAGDFFDDMGLDVFGQSADSTDLPDFSDVVGGSSTVGDDIFSTMGLGNLSLGSIGSSISKLLPSASSLGGLLGGPAGSAAAAGIASGAKSIARGFLRRGGGRRRMNPGNFRALRRAMHRLTSFERAAKRVLHFTHPRPTARIKWKFRRRRKR